MSLFESSECAFGSRGPPDQHVQQIVAQQIDSRVSHHVTPCYSLCHFGYRVKFRYFIRQTHNLSIFLDTFYPALLEKYLCVCYAPHKYQLFPINS